MANSIPVRIPKTSEVTFILGNGFDLGLGMKTSYRDIYKTYVEEDSSSEVIKRFKADLSNKEQYDKWSDFEMGMAKYAETLSSESELIECVRDFKGHLVRHLIAENGRISTFIKDTTNKKDLVRELNNSLTNFYGELSPNDVYKLNQCIDGGTINHNIITFNYTRIIDILMALKSADEQTAYIAPLHIHGSLDKDVVLGVNDMTQLQNIEYAISKKTKRTFVKTAFNEEYDLFRVQKAKQMISRSSTICTYGFSMGESDRMWIECLAEWLKADNKHHLVVYEYDTKVYHKYNAEEIMDAEDEKKEKLIKKLGISEDLFEQIHIPVGADIFNFEFIKIVDTEKAKLPSFN